LWAAFRFFPLAALPSSWAKISHLRSFFPPPPTETDRSKVAERHGNDFRRTVEGRLGSPRAAARSILGKRDYWRFSPSSFCAIHTPPFFFSSCFDSLRAPPSPEAIFPPAPSFPISALPALPAVLPLRPSQQLPYHSERLCPFFVIFFTRVCWRSIAPSSYCVICTVWSNFL